MKQNNFFLSGKLVFLRSVEETDIAIIAPWLNDGEVTHYMFYGQKPTNLSQVREMIMGQVNNPANAVWMVLDLKSKKPIGFCGLYDIHATAQKAEFRILIGTKEFWGKGYGTEITELLTFYGFDRLNLHRVWLGVTSENKGGVKAYERAGYVYEGALNDDIYRYSRYYDTVRMGILRDGYYKKLFKKHLTVFRPSDLADRKPKK